MRSEALIEFPPLLIAGDSTVVQTTPAAADPTAVALRLAWRGGQGCPTVIRVNRGTKLVKQYSAIPSTWSVINRG